MGQNSHSKMGVLVKIRDSANSCASKWLQHSQATWEAQVQA